MRGYANSPHAFSQVRNFNIKFSECNSSHIGDFCPRRVDFEIREERDQDDFQATEAMRPFSQRQRRRTRRTKMRPPRLDVPVAPLRESLAARGSRDLLSRTSKLVFHEKTHKSQPAGIES